MIHRAIYRLIKQVRYMKAVFNKYRGVLVPGRYRLIDNFRSISLTDSVVQNKAQFLFKLEKSSRLRTHIAKFFNWIGYFSVGNRNAVGEYEAIYVANNYDKYREVKLFSFSQKRVLTICTCYEDMCNKLQEYALLNHAYKMPAVEKNSQFENALDIALIDQSEFPGDNMALTAIAKATVSYNRNVDELPRKSIQDLIDFSYDDEQINVLLRQIVSSVDPEILQYKLPICLQHGDLSKVNLLYGSSRDCEGFWFIDWEHKKERVFFYDYFFYVLTSGLYGEMGPFNCYMSGQNDGVLEEFFSHFTLKFYPERRWDYLLIFSIAYLKERVCDLGNIETLKTYCNAINDFNPNVHKRGERI